MTDQRIPSADRQKLRHLLAGSTPGVWKTWATEVMSDQDGTSTCGHAVPVATTHYRDEAGRPRTNDADLICAMRRELPGLLDDLDAERDRANTAERELKQWREWDDAEADRRDPRASG